MFFDLNIRGNSYENNVKLADQAMKYGWNHINFTYNHNDFKQALSFKKELTNEFEDKIAIDYNLEIKSKNNRDVEKTVRKFRSKTSCISVVGGDLKQNRLALENVKIDILSRPYLKRFDSGLNQVLAKEAVNNNVAIELSFGDILRSYLSYRSKILANFKDIYTLYRKFNFPLVLSSGAESVFDIRTPQDFIAFFKQTGLPTEDINKSFKTASDIMKFNENRNDYIFKGVRRVNDEA